MPPCVRWMGMSAATCTSRRTASRKWCTGQALIKRGYFDALSSRIQRTLEGALRAIIAGGLVPGRVARVDRGSNLSSPSRERSVRSRRNQLLNDTRLRDPGSW